MFMHYLHSHTTDKWIMREYWERMGLEQGGRDKDKGDLEGVGWGREMEWSWDGLGNG